MRKILAFSLLLFFAVAAGKPALSQQSSSASSAVKLLINGGLELGGDRIAEVYFTNGNKQSVRAGQGGSLAAGLQWQVPGVTQLLLRGTIGYKYVTTAADNAHIRLSRIPLVFSANYMATPKLRLSSGLALHRNIRFRADGIGPDMAFEGAAGPVFEIAYSGIGLSYTAMQYTGDDKQTYSANAVGLTFSLALPNK